MTEIEDTQQYQHDQGSQSEDPTQIIPPPDVDDSDDSTPVQAFQPGADFSILDTFKQELQELTQAESVKIPVKGYEATGLQIEYRMPATGQEIEKLSRNVNRTHKGLYERNLITAMDMMIYLCEGLYVQPEGVDEPIMLDPHNTGQPCRFDETLGELIGLTTESQNGVQPSARGIVRKLFGNNELAILSHAEKLQRWLQNTKADLSLEIWQTGE